MISPFFRLIALFLFIILLGSCKKEKDPDAEIWFQKAFEIHKVTVKMYKEVAPLRDSTAKAMSLLEELHENGEIQMVSEKLKEKEDAMLSGWFHPDSLVFIQREFHEKDSLINSWLETFPEVRGIDDHMNHHPDHNHGPSLIKGLLPEKYVVIQQLYQDKLKELKVYYEDGGEMLELLTPEVKNKVSVIHTHQ